MRKPFSKTYNVAIDRTRKETYSFKEDVEMDAAVEIDKDSKTARKHIFLWGTNRPYPQPRMTTASRYANKKNRGYIEWRNSLRDTIRVMLGKPYFPDGSQLVMTARFGAKNSEPTRYNKNGKPDKRTITNILNGDLANYLKAWEDVMNGIVYRDDKMIRAYNVVEAHDIEETYFWIHLSQGLITHLAKTQDAA